MCDFCDENNTEESLIGDAGIIYDAIKKVHYLYVEYFRGEACRLEVKFCTECARAF